MVTDREHTRVCVTAACKGPSLLKWLLTSCPAVKSTAPPLPPLPLVAHASALPVCNNNNFAPSGGGGSSPPYPARHVQPGVHQCVLTRSVPHRRPELKRFGPTVGYVSLPPSKVDADAACVIEHSL